MASILRVDQANVDTIYAKTAGGSVYIPGHVIQYVDYKVPQPADDYVVISSNTIWDTPVTLSITPRFATSKLVVHAECQIRFVNALGMGGGIKRDGNAMTGAANQNHLAWFYKGDSVNHHAQLQCNASVIAGSTSTTTFTLWLRPADNTGEYNRGWGTSFIQIWEIAQ